jgi:hypothetical protein
MIHGHEYISDIIDMDFINNIEIPTTKDYFPCGDLRELSQILQITKGSSGIMNLINHGFLIYSNNLHTLYKLVNTCQFTKRKIGDELAPNQHLPALIFPHE